jgi:hypothetical protein
MRNIFIFSVLRGQKTQGGILKFNYLHGRFQEYHYYLTRYESNIFKIFKQKLLDAQNSCFFSVISRIFIRKFLSFFTFVVPFL